MLVLKIIGGLFLGSIGFLILWQPFGRSIKEADEVMAKIFEDKNKQDSSSH